MTSALTGKELIMVKPIEPGSLDGFTLFHNLTGSKKGWQLSYRAKGDTGWSVHVGIDDSVSRCFLDMLSGIKTDPPPIHLIGEPTQVRGEIVKVIEADQPGETFEAFYRQTLTKVAEGMGLTWDDLTGNVLADPGNLMSARIAVLKRWFERCIGRVDADTAALGVIRG